jgi:predicted nucleic acid-binding protein
MFITSWSADGTKGSTRRGAVIPKLLNYPVPTAKLISDAYLAAFAIASSRRLITLDRGFRQFPRLELHC